jgi:hypothetical protein
VTLWDGKQGVFEKRTKMSGNDTIENPWINLIACTTPAWIAGNFPEYMIGGGFTSRCVFVYAEAKNKYVAYPGLHVPKDMKTMEDRLVQDLEHISITHCGQYNLTEEAIEWGEKWYKAHYMNGSGGLDSDRFGGYIARKQTHIHKLAMILAASVRDELTINIEDLQIANKMVSDLEEDMPAVFSKIGRTDLSLQTDRFLAFVYRNQRVTYEAAYRAVHNYFPSQMVFVDMVKGCQAAGLVRIEQNGQHMYIIALNRLESAAEPSQQPDRPPSPAGEDPRTGSGKTLGQG